MWKKGDENYSKQKQDQSEEALKLYGHLLQSIRLEKLLSKDELYLIEFPKSMPKIVEDYFKDLIEENQVVGDPAVIKKTLGSSLYKFIRETVSKQLEIK